MQRIPYRLLDCKSVPCALTVNGLIQRTFINTNCSEKYSMSRPALKNIQPYIQRFWRYSGRGVKLMIQLHLVPRIRISGALPLNPQYVLMACTVTSPFFFFKLKFPRSKSTYLPFQNGINISTYVLPYSSSIHNNERQAGLSYT